MYIHFYPKFVVLFDETKCVTSDNKGAILLLLYCTNSNTFDNFVIHMHIYATAQRQRHECS